MRRPTRATSGAATTSLLLAGDVVGRRVVAANGRSLGHVIDVELRPVEDGLEVIALELGRYGWLDRLHLLRPLASRVGSRELRLIPWSEVDRIDDAVRLGQGDGKR